MAPFSHRHRFAHHGAPGGVKAARNARPRSGSKARLAERTMARGPRPVKPVGAVDADEHRGLVFPRWENEPRLVTAERSEGDRVQCYRGAGGGCLARFGYTILILALAFFLLLLFTVSSIAETTHGGRLSGDKEEDEVFVPSAGAPVELQSRGTYEILTESGPLTGEKLAADLTKLSAVIAGPSSPST